jgi:hypothetical protein
VYASSSTSCLFSLSSLSETPLNAKDVAYLLDNRDDPEVDAAIKAYLKAQFSGGKDSSSTSTEHFELASKVEKKYIAAQVISQGVLVSSLSPFDFIPSRSSNKYIFNAEHCTAIIL